MKTIASFFSRGVFGTSQRDGQDVAEYLFFIAVLVGIILLLNGTISDQFVKQAEKLFTGK